MSSCQALVTEDVTYDAPLGLVVDPPWIACKKFMYLPFGFFETYIDDQLVSVERAGSVILDINRIEWLGEMAEFMESKNQVFNKDLIVSFMMQRMKHTQYYWYGIRFLDDTVAVEFKLKFGSYEPPHN